MLRGFLYFTQSLMAWCRGHHCRLGWVRVTFLSRFQWITDWQRQGLSSTLSFSFSFQINTRSCELHVTVYMHLIKKVNSLITTKTLNPCNASLLTYELVLHNCPVSMKEQHKSTIVVNLHIFQWRRTSFLWRMLISKDSYACIAWVFFGVVFMFSYFYLSN